jgi:alpha/beta superfamily hydrolase
MDDFRAAIEVMAARYPGAPIWAAGMSFGSWIALTVGAEDPRVSTLVGIALPVARYDFGPVARSAKAKFFVHGERDDVCPLKEVRVFYGGAAEPKELVVIDGADHLFDGKVGEVADAVEDLLGDWNG